jgi:hypothetical protein
MLTTFHERYEKLMSDHQAAKKMELVRPSVDQIGQPVQNSHKMNGNGAKWKQLADTAEADRRTFCTDGVYRLVSRVCRNIQGNEVKLLTEQYGIVTGRYFANRTKQSTKGEQKLWK